MRDIVPLLTLSLRIFQGLAPAFIGDLADIAGRRPAYILCFCVYIVANIGLALQKSFAALIVLRCLQSSGSSGTIALSSGVVADVSTVSERGKWFGLVTAGSLLGPSLGPAIGGLLAEKLGWRAIFWFLGILAGVFLVPLLIFFPETGTWLHLISPTVIRGHAEPEIGRNIVGNGSIPPASWNMSFINYMQLRERRRVPLNPSLKRAPSIERLPKSNLHFPNPLASIKILLDKETSLLLFYNGFLFATFYDIGTSLPYLFAQIYHLKDLHIGLCYLPFGAGCLVAALCNGQLLDRNFRRIAKKLSFPLTKGRQSDLATFPIEKARLQIAIPAAYLACVSMLTYGWTLAFDGPLAVALVLLFSCSLTMTATFNVSSTLLVDFYPHASATATAANNLVRCSLGAGATALIVPMIDGMGCGWCFTFLSLCMVVASPMLWSVFFHGQRWRQERGGRVVPEAGSVTAARKG